MNEPAFIVHGGAWDVPPELEEPCRQGVRRAVDIGWDVLKAGGSALDACERAIVEMEDDPVFDAGIGSYLNRDGNAQLDAILMDGATLKSGAVACVEHIRNPIQLARRILDKSDHMLFCGQGAELFAVENGMALCDPAIFRISSELARWTEKSMGTVGAVALDIHGHLGAGTSTGGTVYKYPGRVGDAPLVGCGCYADNEGAGVSSTGHGESIMKVVMAKMVNDLVAAGHSPQAAADEAIALTRRRVSGSVGVIVLDRAGRIGAAFSTQNLVHAFRTSSLSEPVVRV